jgi:hypothetical protein
MEPKVNYRISLEFWGSTDVVLTVGPLQITSINSDEGDWGSFEILWDDRIYLYCHYFPDFDPFTGVLTGYGVPEWMIERCGARPRPKTIWNSLHWFGRIHARFDRWIDRLRGS